MNAQSFAVQFAIRCPSGRLYHQPGEKQTVEEFSSYSAWMNMLFGGTIFIGDEPPTPSVSQPKPVIFDSREDAEAKLAELRELALKVGVDNYGGAVVSRLCSPFTDSPAPQQFAQRVAEWLTSQEQGL